MNGEEEEEDGVFLGGGRGSQEHELKSREGYGRAWKGMLFLVSSFCAAVKLPPTILYSIRVFDSVHATSDCTPRFIPPFS